MRQQGACLRDKRGAGDPGGQLCDAAASVQGRIMVVLIIAPSPMAEVYRSWRYPLLKRCSFQGCSRPRVLSLKERPFPVGAA